MFEKYPRLELSLKSYWSELYSRRYMSDDNTIEFWGYSNIRFIPIGKSVLNMNVDGDLSDKGFAFLNKILSRVKYSYYPLDSGGAFVDYKLRFFSSRYGRSSFFKYKNELIDLGLLISFGNNYYVFNPKHFNTIRNTKVNKS